MQHIIFKNKSRTLKAKFPLLSQSTYTPAVIAIAAVIAFSFLSEIEALFIYSRDEINSGEVWRLITGHLFHTNFNHLLLNVVALLLLWSLHGKFYSTKSYLTLFFLSALFISLAIYFFDPEMKQYVGLSGILHAVFVWGALKDIKAKDKTGYLLLIGVLVKIVYEQSGGSSEFTANLINAPVAINAHLYGVVIGIIVFLFSNMPTKKPK